MRSRIFHPFEEFVNRFACPKETGDLTEARKPLLIHNLKDASRSLFAAILSTLNRDFTHVIVTGRDGEARRLSGDIRFFSEVLNGGDGSHVYLLPEGDDPLSVTTRLRGLINSRSGGVLVGSRDVFLSSAWSVEDLKRTAIVLKPGMEFQREDLVGAILRMGYRRRSLVSDLGEFSERGWILDIFPPELDKPVRIELFGDEIEALKTFQVDSQRSDGAVQDLTILPVRDDAEGPQVIDSIPSESFCCLFDPMHGADAGDGPVLRCGDDGFSGFMRTFCFDRIGLEGRENAPVKALAGYGFLHSERRDVFGLSSALKGYEGAVMIVLPAEAQIERIREILREGDLIVPFVDIKDIAGYRGRYAVTKGRLSEGVNLGETVVLTEKEIFGRRSAYKPHKGFGIKRLIENTEDLKEGDFIVHRDHGIGSFIGLQHHRAGGHEGEAMVIEYAEGRLYLPLHNIGLIRKYKAEQGVVPLLDRLGSRKWKKRKERARKRIREMARKLISLYAHREVLTGYSFSPDTELHREFEAFFPYEDTPDQRRAWEEIKAEMESKRAMDRLLCGDVGFGKTEVAMRAAFKAVYDNKQVAVLVPTTILAEQHYRNFMARFSAFPINIDFLSRFKTASEKKKTIEAIANGGIDIIIGTHALLRKSLVFYDLGLLIVDEEHRFGVAHKERIKELKKKVDCLTMSATPIPRTLELSLSGIREMSLIETPPEERIAIKGMVVTFDEEVLRHAIVKELEREGQVYFVHNRVKDIDRMKDYLTGLVPGVSIAVAHGQMKERELEDIMLRFMDGNIDLLLCTAIIGSGIDVPSANTIIINRADRMGLADLYQLKGRVGRSNLNAYAYFIIPGTDSLTEEARGRIEAIEELNYLGAGLKLAMKDLEIRGAGNLLGAQQSGHIHAVGFDMYMEMLSEEVARMKGIEVEEERDISIDLGLNAFIPGDYIEDVTGRLSIYRRLNLCRSEEDVDALAEEIKDRFGPLPEEMLNLIETVRIRTLAMRLKISAVSSRNGDLGVRFFEDTPLHVDSLINVQKHYLGRVLLSEEGFFVKGGKGREPGSLVTLKEILNSLVRLPAV